MIPKLARFCSGMLGCAGLLGGSQAQAADPGDQVVVVYNSKVPESKALAEYYATKRHVPTNQVFGFDLPTGEEMSRGEYQNLLQFPLAKAIKSDKLWHFETELAPATNHEPAKVIWPTTLGPSSATVTACVAGNTACDPAPLGTLPIQLPTALQFPLSGNPHVGGLLAAGV